MIAIQRILFKLLVLISIILLFSACRGRQPPSPTPIHSYVDLLPLSFPLLPITTKQLAEVRSCEMESLPQQRYPDTISTVELDNHFSPTTACDWAVLSVAYINRLKYGDPIPEQGKRAFIQAILLNPAFLFSTELFYSYYDNFSLVSLPNTTDAVIKNTHIDYHWYGMGDPLEMSYQIDISSIDNTPSLMSVYVSAPPEQITSNLRTEIDSGFIQDIAKALTDFVPIDQQFSLTPCTDNLPDWHMTLLFQDGSQLDLQTNGSNMATIGGPWQMEIDGQSYLQFSYALPRAIYSLFEQLKLPFGEPRGMYCDRVPILDLAFP